MYIPYRTIVVSISFSIIPLGVEENCKFWIQGGVRLGGAGVEGRTVANAKTCGVASDNTESIKRISLSTSQDSKAPHTENPHNLQRRKLPRGTAFFVYPFLAGPDNQERDIITRI